jgi:cysteine dioxygenase type I
MDFRLNGGSGRPQGRDLEPSELRGAARWIAARPELWQGLVEHHPEQRIYRELLHDDHLAVWLICWLEGHDTGFHDHDGSAGAVVVAEGELREERLRIGAPPEARAFGPGDLFDFGPSDIHRVLHAGRGGPAVSVHAYSPPLRRMGSYVVEETGALRRLPLSYTDELRPLATLEASA